MTELAYHMARGRAFLNNADYQGAVHEFTQAIECDRNHLPAYLYRAEANDDCGDPTDSVTDYQVIIHLDNQSAEAAFAQAELLIRSILQRPRSEYPNLYREAIAMYTEAIERDPQLDLAYCERARLHIELGNLREAIDDYSRCQELNPDYALVYAMRANVYGRMGLYAAAIRDLEIFLRLPAGAARNRHEMEQLAHYWMRLAQYG